MPGTVPAVGQREVLGKQRATALGQTLTKVGESACLDPAHASLSQQPGDRGSRLHLIHKVLALRTLNEVEDRREQVWRVPRDHHTTVFLDLVC